jgi:hypothetical protein
MSYYKLNDICSNFNDSLTDNTKFYSLNNPVYYKGNPYMIKYPGESSLYNNFPEPDHKHPPVIKSYFGKMYEHDADSDHIHTHDHCSGGCRGGHGHEHNHDHAPNHGHGPLQGFNHNQTKRLGSCRTCKQR